MKILIISDTHRNDLNLKKILPSLKPLDLLIHCGDAEGSEELIEELAGCRTKMVAGNNDFFTTLPKEQEFMLGNYRVWLVHGHQYGVAMGAETIKGEAVDRGVDIVMFGHSHRPLLDQSGGITALNPGSLSYPRQEGRKPSYMIMEIDQKGEAHFTVRYL